MNPIFPRFWHMVFASCCLAGALLAGCDMRSAGGPGRDATTHSAPDVNTAGVGLDVGDLAPDITAADADGELFSLSDYRGKVVVLSFWGDW